MHDHWLNTLRASAVAGALACCLPCWPLLHAQINQTSQPSLPTIDAFTRNMQRSEGFFPFFHNPENGRLFLEIPRLEDRFLYFASQATGITWPAERGNMSEQAALVHFERSGPRVLLIENNPRLVVTGADSARVMPAIAASFGSGILATFMAAADQEGRLLIDATDFDDLLERHRLERIVSLHASDSAQPSLEELLITLVDSTWQVPPSSDSQLAALQRIAGRGVLDRLAAVARDTAATIEVRAAVNATLLELRDRLSRRETSDPVERAHLALALRDIDRAR